MEPEQTASSGNLHHSAHDTVTGLPVTNSEFRAQQRGTYKAALLTYSTVVWWKEPQPQAHTDLGSKPSSLTATLVSWEGRIQNFLLQRVPL